MLANGFDGWLGLETYDRHVDAGKQAMATFSKCLDINGDDIAALLGLFRVSTRMGKTERIKFYLKQYLSRHPHDIAIMLCLASILITEDNYDAAQDVLIDVLILDNTNETATCLIEELDNLKAQNNIVMNEEMRLLQAV